MKSRSLWLAAVVIGPCAVLTFLFLRFLNQERQLAVRRSSEAAVRRLADARQSFLSQFEPVRTGAQPAAFEGIVKAGRLVLPWQRRENAAAMLRLEKAIRSRDAAELRALAALPASVTDEHGVPIAVYALARPASVD